MKNELNNYQINNPDGASKEKFSEKKQRYSNESPDFVKEYPLEGQGETYRAPESYEFGRENSYSRSSSQKSSQSDGGSSGGSSASSSSSASSATSSATSSAASGASSAASASSAIGSSIGTLAGTVAASVAAAVVVVAVFVSTLVINLSLVSAGMNNLVFQVEMRGAQEEDFITPIVAVLEGEGDVHQEVEIYQDTVYLAFENLEPGKEYTVRVKNEEKTFAKMSFFTATEEVEQGTVSAWSEENEVFISVDDIVLKSGEFYTVTAKDAKGGKLFAADGVEPNDEFQFTVSEEGTVYVTLSIGGSVCGLAQAEVVIEPEPEPEPEYDFNNGQWTWVDDFSRASISFAEIHGKEPLAVEAEVSSRYTEPTCENAGVYNYVATAAANGTAYTDEKTAEVENSALGHDYKAVVTKPTCTEEGYTTYTCTRCGESHVDDRVATYGHEYEKRVTPPTCTEIGYTTYVCLLCGEEYVSNETNALGHDYREPQFVWRELSDGFAATAVFTCSHDESHVIEMEANVRRVIVTEATCENDAICNYVAEVTYNDVDYSNVLENMSLAGTALGHTYGNLIEEVDAECEEDGIETHYRCTVCGKYFDLNKNEVSEEELIIPAIGHEYGQPYFNWTQLSDGFAATATFACMHNQYHTVEVDATVSKDGDTYYAEVEFEGKWYYDEYYVASTSGGQGCEISLEEGAIHINANGYARSESGLSSPTEFVSSATNPYLIQDQEVYGCDNIITVYQNNSSVATADIYIKLKDVTLKAGSWCSLFLIKNARNTVNITLIIEGTVTFAGGSGQQIFSSQGSGSPTVNIIIDQTTAGGTFNAEISDGLTYAASGTVNVSYK